MVGRFGFSWIRGNYRYKRGGDVIEMAMIGYGGGRGGGGGFC